MINLLPTKEKEALYLEQIKNLAMILGSVLVIVLICLALILLAVKFYILSAVDYQKFLNKGVDTEYKSSDLSTYKDYIQKYNAILPQILSFYKKDLYFSDILDAISKVERPKGLYFLRISLDKGYSENEVKVVVSGISDTRENLLSFQKNLQQAEKFKNIYFSADSWINPVNTNFSLNFELSKNDN